PRDRAQDSLDVARHALPVDRALEHPRTDAIRARDALGDVPHEHVDHRLRPADDGPTEAEVPRDLVVGIDTRGDDDVDVDLLGDAHDARDITAQADDGQVDDCVE